MEKETKIQMTPAKIALLLHYHYSPVDIENFDAPGTQSDIHLFKSLGIFAYEPTHYCTRKAGQLWVNVAALDAYMEELMKIQPPVKVINWICEHII